MSELCQCGHLATDHSGNGIGDRTGCYECDDTEQSGICVCTRFTPPMRLQCTTCHVETDELTYTDDGQYCKKCAPPVDEREKVYQEVRRTNLLGCMEYPCAFSHEAIWKGGFDAGHAARDAEVERYKAALTKLWHGHYGQEVSDIAEEALEEKS